MNAFTRKDLEYTNLFRARLENVVKIDQPLILISQAPRSGGTLLSQLFDGHPELHVHPPELRIGYPHKTLWPVLNLTDEPETWFNMLAELSVVVWSRDGYRKYARGADAHPDAFDTLSFLFMPTLQREIFCRCTTSSKIERAREVFDCYMTSFFNAWLDNHNLYHPHKKFITGFTPRMSMREENVKAFFDVYPDGRLISILREPRSWYCSARVYDYKWGDIDEQMELWESAAHLMVRNKERYGERVFILSFEKLLSDTEDTMRSLSEYLGIEFSQVLLEPTFNGFLIKADSSYKVENYGVIQSPLTRYKEILTNEEMEYIDSRASAIYNRVLEYADKS